MGCMRSQMNPRRLVRGALLAAAAAGLSVALLLPAQAQFWGSWGNAPPQRQQRQPQQQYNPFGGGWFGGPERSQREREAPADYSRAPATQRKQDAAPTTTIVVMGDGMSDWLALGLEEAFAEKPEIGILRKNRTASGLIRYDTRRDAAEWPQVAKDIITADKPKFIVMMVGVNDRQSIRERPPTPATPAAPASKGAAAAKQQPAPAPAAPAPADPELQAQQSADQQNAEMQTPAEPPPAAAPEPGRGANSAASAYGPWEFHSEKWEAAYIKRIDATIAALKSGGVPVFWVGLPSQRNAKATTDSAYLNELFRQRAEKAGITYIDVWDGFVDDGGRFTAQGPDFEGQTRRLRAGDGVYFTKAGARKLAHYVEREIQRGVVNRAVPVALPEIAAPAPAAPGARPGGPAQRPLAGPVVPLTVSTGGPSELLGGGPTRPAANDPVANRVLIKGEPIPAPSGRADDFSWPPKPNAATSEPAVAAPNAGQAKAQPAAIGQRATTEGSAEDAKPLQRRARTTPPAGDNAPRPPAAVRPSASAPSGGWWR
ncbi:MAG: uncharacterized protein QOI12_797 [Alphaproteobacteria bacterium]|nr:uncharacterized protein [Alphaproteobacteria bacterium]